VFKNGELKRILVPKWNEVRGRWRKLHNEELLVLYCLMFCTAYCSVLLNVLYCLMFCTA